MNAATITVTSPHAADIWYKGHPYTITWTSTSIPASTNIKINIFKDSINQANFKLQLTCTNTSLKSWTIPTSFENGTYYIRVKTEDNAVHGDSGAFTISEGGGYSGPIIGTERAPVEILDTVSVKAPINAPVRKLETTTKPITPAYKFQIQAIKPILNTPDR